MTVFASLSTMHRLHHNTDVHYWQKRN